MTRKTLACAALLIPCILQAVNITWDGSALDGDWSTAENWDLNRQTIASDTVLISNGDTVTISAGTDAVASSVRIASPSGSSGTLNITGGSLTLGGTGFFGLSATSTGASTAIVNQSGGVVSAIDFQSGTAAPLKTGTYNLSGGSLTISNTTKIGEIGESVFNQTAGSFSTATLSVVSNVSTNAANTTRGTYSIAGGTLTVSGNLTNGAVANANAGTADAKFQVIGSGATINVGGNYATGVESATRHATLDVKVDNGGLSKINLTGTGTATVDGTLTAGIKGGVALTSSSSFSLIEADTGKISGSFDTNPNATLWATPTIQAISGSRDALVLSYASGADKGSLTQGVVSDLDFTAASTGFVTLNGLSTSGVNAIYLDANAGSGKTTGDLIAFFLANGINASTSDLGEYSVLLSLSSLSSTAFFGWDLADFNATATLSGIGLQTSSIPEPSTGALILGAACLTSTLGMRRSRHRI